MKTNDEVVLKDDPNGEVFTVVSVHYNAVRVLNSDDKIIRFETDLLELIREA